MGSILVLAAFNGSMFLVEAVSELLVFIWGLEIMTVTFWTCVSTDKWWHMLNSRQFSL